MNRSTLAASGVNTNQEKKLRFVTSLKIDESYSVQHAFFPHTHSSELELLYIYSGHGKYLVDNHYYDVKRGDIIISNANILHGEDPSVERSMQSYSVRVTDFQAEGLPANCLTDKQCPVVSCGQLADQIEDLVRLIYLLSADTTHLSHICDTLAYSLILLAQELLHSRERQDVGTLTNGSILAYRVRQYLDSYHNQTISLDEIAKKLNCSKYYMIHVFTDEFGLPPKQYIAKRRIGEAQQLLTETHLPISEISDRLGYNSPSHFNTMFLKYVGKTPGQFRQSFRVMNDQM